MAIEPGLPPMIGHILAMCRRTPKRNSFMLAPGQERHGFCKFERHHGECGHAGQFFEPLAPAPVAATDDDCDVMP